MDGQNQNPNPQPPATKESDDSQPQLAMGGLRVIQPSAGLVKEMEGQSMNNIKIAPTAAGAPSPEAAPAAPPQNPVVTNPQPTASVSQSPAGSNTPPLTSPAKPKTNPLTLLLQKVASAFHR